MTDLVLVNANVLTMDPARPRASAVAIAHGRITALDEIPPGARIFALADALDAMTSERPYRRTLSWEDAVEEVLKGSGSQFDPRVVQVFALREQRLHRTQHDLAHTA